jgi:hypothetical protein
MPMPDEELDKVQVLGPEGQRTMAAMDKVDVWALDIYLRSKLNEMRRNDPGYQVLLQRANAVRLCRVKTNR